MSNTMMQAFNQWCTRPADERFNSLDAFAAAVQRHRNAARETHGVDLTKCEVQTHESDAPVLVGPTGRAARFTHWSFSQMARAFGAPAAYLQTLPGKLVTSLLNHGIHEVANATGNEVHATDADKMRRNATLLFGMNGDIVDHDDVTIPELRALTSSRYTRIWNADVVKRLRRLVDSGQGWEPAPAGFDGCRGLYASDRDMFAFFVDNNRRIFEKLPGGGLSRGFFVENSEVGAGSFVMTTFLYEWICGNHRVIGATNVKEVRLRHVGSADSRADAALVAELRAYANASESDDVTRIQKMQRHVLGADKNAVLDVLFRLKLAGVSQRMLTASVERAETREDRYGNPRSVWAVTGAMTELSQERPNASDRVALDRAAAKVMQVAF